MNSSPMGGFRGGRDDGGRGKRGEGRNRQGGGNANNFVDSSNWKTTSRNSYSVDTSKLKAVTNKVRENCRYRHCCGSNLLRLFLMTCPGVKYVIK